jgi:hypothetical protein
MITDEDYWSILANLPSLLAIKKKIEEVILDFFFPFSYFGLVTFISIPSMIFLSVYDYRISTLSIKLSGVWRGFVLALPFYV